MVEETHREERESNDTWQEEGGLEVKYRNVTFTRDDKAYSWNIQEWLSGD